MNWHELLNTIDGEPVFKSSLLLSGDLSVPQVLLQLSRWVKAGRLIQLRRGVYVLASPWRKADPHPFLVANRLQRGSYVSLQSALAFHGIIPEHVPVVTSVGPGRPETVNNALGKFLFQHVAGAMLYGYSEIEVVHRQFAFVASPEKALLDLVHLTPGADSPDYLKELRLQNLEILKPKVIEEMARRSGKPKLIRAARRIEAVFSTAEEVIL